LLSNLFLTLQMNQTTIAKPIETSGIGLHTGVEVNLTLKPAPENSGYIFVRTDLDDFEIPASVEYISHCSYATTLLRRGVLLSTCEHLLAALRGSNNFTLDNGSFGREIAAARTFGFTTEIEMLRKANLALGGSLDNAIVLTPDGMLNEKPLRYKDEFVRHKTLDIIGDFALLGMPILGKLKAEKSGHAVHASLMSKLLKTESAWQIVEKV